MRILNSGPMGGPMERTTADQRRIEDAVTAILEAVGEDPAREGLRQTPSRVARMYSEVFSGVGVRPEQAIDTVFEAEGHDPVMVGDLTFYSVCEHHLLPFFGQARIAYVPNGKIAGISKLARALDVAACRPQVQERLTAEVAEAVFTVLQPDGVIVELEAEHLCMSMRGVRKPGTRVLTSAVRGAFKDYPLGREGLLALLHGR